MRKNRSRSNPRRAFVVGIIAGAGLLACSGAAPVTDWGPGADASAPPDRGDGGVTEGGKALPDPRGHCPTGSTPCGGACVSPDDPAFGCGSLSCAPCAVPRGVATCAFGACAVGRCEAGRGDCDALADNGCETSVTSAHDHCGTCVNRCGVAEVCNMGACDTGCAGGLTDCGGSCVNVAADPAHCGSCSTLCGGTANGSSTCVGAQCGVSCDAGYHACQGACVSAASTASCGTSCVACATPPNANPTCNGVACDFTCSAGYKRSGAACVSIDTSSCTPENTCATATDLGTVDGDGVAVTRTGTGTTSAWFSVRVHESDLQFVGTQQRVTVGLASPPGSNYDLFLYENAATDLRECATLTGSSTNASSSDSASLSWGEGTLSNAADDSRTVSIEVRFVSGSCGPFLPWSLTVTGNR